MNYQNNYTYNNSNLNYIPFQMRFENCLKDPICLKCINLSKLIQESIATNLKEIHLIYNRLVDDIFGVGLHSMSTDWSLKLISFNYNRREFESIYAFLEPNGTFFQLIRQLMNDPSNRYEFPKSYLPIPTKQSLEEGVVPSFYINKISHVLSNTISLNAFEFFLFNFAYNMLNTSSTLYGQQNPHYLALLSNANTNPSNIVYFALLESYLNYLVPILSTNQSIMTSSTLNPQSSTGIWHSLTSSSFLHFGTASNTLSPKQITSSSLSQTSNLFKASVLSCRPSLVQNSEQLSQFECQSGRLTPDSLGSELVKCETFLLVVTEIWLNHAIPHSTAKRNSSPTKQTLSPNSDHMRAVRILVKHLHCFANSCNKRTNNSQNIIDSSPLDEIKRLIWTQKYVIQKKLYTFLRMSFDRWPNDTSFRLPLETWLSYIQPWRYTIDTNGFKTNSKKEVTLTDDSRWKQFVSDNLLFYSVIFRQLIPRFSKLYDLSSHESAKMLFRITKVFSQPNLSNWIQEFENSLMSSDSSSANLLQTNWSSNSRTSLLSPTIRQQNVNAMTANIRHPLMELESNCFEYIPLFCPAIKPLILQLLIEISKAVKVVEEFVSKTALSDEMSVTSNSTFIQYLMSFFQLSDDYTTLDDKRRTLADNTTEYLIKVSEQLSVLFEVPAPATDSMLSSNHNQSTDANSASVGGQTRALYEDKSGTPVLTSFGRTQILNRVCRPQLTQIEGNPDRQPVRSFEFYYLVHFLLFISDLINRKYGQKIQNLYNREGLVGIFVRQLITGPTVYVETIKSVSADRPPERITQVLNPRINLRFIANKVFLFYALLVLTIVYILGYSLLYFESLLFAMYLTYLLTKTVLIAISQ